MMFAMRVSGLVRIAAVSYLGAFSMVGLQPRLVACLDPVLVVWTFVAGWRAVSGVREILARRRDGARVDRLTP
jgi:hypothetical protein